MKANQVLMGQDRRAERRREVNRRLERSQRNRKNLRNLFKKLRRNNRWKKQNQAVKNKKIKKFNQKCNNRKKFILILVKNKKQMN